MYVWIGNGVCSTKSPPTGREKRLREFPPLLMFDAVFIHKNPPPPPLFHAEIPVYLRRLHRQIMHTADLPSPQPANVAPPLQRQARRNRQFLPPSCSAAAHLSGNSCRPAIFAARIRLSTPYQTGNTCRPAIIAAQLRIRTASDRDKSGVRGRSESCDGAVDLP